jgi:hypothetical protein
LCLAITWWTTETTKQTIRVYIITHLQVLRQVAMVKVKFRVMHTQQCSNPQRTCWIGDVESGSLRECEKYVVFHPQTRKRLNEEFEVIELKQSSLWELKFNSCFVSPGSPFTVELECLDPIEELLS